MKAKHKIIPSGYVVIKRGGEVLLSRRYNTGFMDGMYGLPAGHGEEFESLIGCAIREVKEEIGINLKQSDLQLGHIMNRYSGKYSKDCRIDGFFVLENYDEDLHGPIVNMEPEKCDDLSWFPIDKLPDNIIPYIKIALENIDKKIIFSEV
jgi:8-oxo-dGTP pyrophosphatase MutT (NUDIX family)